MDLESNSNSTSSSRSIGEEAPMPEGYKHYIVISKKPPKKGKKRNVVHKEISNDVTVEDLLNDIKELHKELEDVVKIGKKISVDCSGCFSNCMKLNTTADVDTNVNAEGNKVSFV